LPTWTHAALSSEARPLKGTCWRTVEAQHLVSTLKLVDSLAEQTLLENLLEETKPSIPPECWHLHYLLATPFRYGTVYPRGSRFRRAGRTAGVYYASETPPTSVAEIAFYRLLFFAESPATPWPANPAEYTAFAVPYSGRGIDLTLPQLSRDQSAWTDLTEYAACQTLADTARAADLQVIRYQSVRDPQAGGNLALLTCKAFAGRSPRSRQSWRLHISSQGIQALCEFPRYRLEFSRETFANDPRIASLVWER
jgi:hypothetical protein